MYVCMYVCIYVCMYVCIRTLELYSMVFSWHLVKFLEIDFLTSEDMLMVLTRKLE